MSVLRMLGNSDRGMVLLRPLFRRPIMGVGFIFRAGNAKQEIRGREIGRASTLDVQWHSHHHLSHYVHSRATD
jgi:hypothetical protein